MKTDDLPLVRAAQNGELYALDHLLRHHYDRIYAVIRGIAGQNCDADNACQEALIKIVQNLPTFDSRSSFSTWVYRIATIAARDALQRKRLMLRERDDLGDKARPDQERHHHPTAHRELNSITDQLTLDEAFDDLASDYRTAVVLCDIGDLDYAEIADLLAVPVGTVKSRIARGRRHLADRICLDDRAQTQPTTTTLQARINSPIPTRTSPRRHLSVAEPQAAIQTPKELNMHSGDRSAVEPDVLASAYLDGEATPDERALIEGDQELLAAVDQLGVVPTIIDGLDPAAVSVREAHLAAALNLFSLLQTAGRPAVIPAGASRTRRTRGLDDPNSTGRTKMVGVIAVLLIMVGGIAIVLRNVIGSLNEDGRTLIITTVEEPSEETIGPSEAEIAAEIRGDNTNDKSPIDFDESEIARDVLESDLKAMAADAAPDFPKTNRVVLESRSEVSGLPPEMDPAIVVDELSAADLLRILPTEDLTSVQDPPPETELVALITSTDLIDFAAPAAYAPGLTGTDTRLMVCAAAAPDGLGVDRLAEPAIVLGEQVFVGVNLDLNMAYAYRADCSVLLQAEVPSKEEFLKTIPPTPAISANP